ncbi:MAG: ParB N-terminal domain-containing protein, partial [Pseudomonadota bacterium]
MFTVTIVPVDILKPHPDNEKIPLMDEDTRQRLMEDIRQNGIATPLILARDYTILAGHERWKIAKELGMTHVPAIIRQDVGPESVEALALLVNDNLLRKHYSDMQKAQMIRFLKEKYEVKPGRPESGKNRKENREIISQLISVTERRVNQLDKLNDLVPEFQKLVLQKKLSSTAAHSLAFLPPEEQKQLLETLGESGVCGLSVKEAQELRKELDSARKEKEALNSRLVELEEEKRSLSDQLADVQDSLSLMKEEVAEKLGRQYEEKLQEALSGLQKRLRESREEAEGLRAKLKELKAKPVEKVVEKVVYKTDPEQEEKLRERELKIALLEAQLQELRQASSTEPGGLSEEIERLRAEKKVLEAEVNRGRAASQFTRTVRGLIRQLEREEPTVENLSYSVDRDGIAPYYVEAQRWIGTLERYVRHIRNAF